MTDNLTIQGHAGALEARYDAAPGTPAVQAVLCHPHPQYGGSMHDGVLAALADVLIDAGIGVLRFNLRGVGGSAGRYDGGAGEVEDLLAAADWLVAAHPGARLWAGGYSFGAWVTWQALDRGLAPAHAILLAPPVGAMPFPSRPGELPTDVVIGSRDDFADPAALDAWSDVTLYRIDGADHFFTGHHDDLDSTLRQIVATRNAPP